MDHGPSTIPARRRGAGGDDRQSSVVGEHREPRAGRRSLRNRTIAAVWAVVRTHGRDDAWLYAEASAEIGRLLQAGFGLTTCTDQEIGRILVRVKRALGLPVQEYSRPRATDHRPRGRDRRPRLTAGGQGSSMVNGRNVVRIASVEQFQFARALEAELHIGMDEAAGIAARACGSRVPRTAVQVSKYTEALKAIRRRRLAAAAGRSTTDNRRPEVS